MAVHSQIEFASVDELKLDPMNPRLGRDKGGPNLKQSEVMELMRDFTLEELAVSFIESRMFWPQEALIVVEEKLDGKTAKVVVEGNRRLAALLYLRDAVDDKPASAKWREIAEMRPKPSDSLFMRVPYILADSRKDVAAFLGFRHVTGIKEWAPAEKAEYIAKLIDEDGLDYEQVRRRIGSKFPVVRQHYLAFNILRQIEDQGIQLAEVENRFSVMYLSLRSSGVQDYLGIDAQALPKKAKVPVARSHYRQLKHFAVWLFGAGDRPPLFTDSRHVDDFGDILQNQKAVDYLERNDAPNFAVALSLAGGDEKEVGRQLDIAADNIELALSRLHLFKSSKKIDVSLRRLAKDAVQALSLFPVIAKEVATELGR